MEIYNYLNETRGIQVILTDITPIKNINNNLVFYGYDKKSWQTIYLIKNEAGDVVCKKRDDGTKLKLINKGGSFKNNPCVCPAIPDDKLELIGDKIYGNKDFYKDKDRTIIYITEGLEDALSIRQVTGCEVWAVAGFWNFIFDVEKLPAELIQKITERECVLVFDRIKFNSQIAFKTHKQVIDNHYRDNDYRINYVIPPEDSKYKDSNDYLKADNTDGLLDLLNDVKTGDEVLKLFYDVDKRDENEKKEIRKIEKKIEKLNLIETDTIAIRETKQNLEKLKKLNLPYVKMGEYLMLDNTLKTLKVFKNPVGMMKYIECWDYFDGWNDLSTSTPFICFRNSKGEREYYKAFKESKMVDEHIISEMFINEKNELDKVYFDCVWKNIFYIDGGDNLRSLKDYFFDYLFKSDVGAGCHYLKDFSKNKGFCFMNGKMHYNISEKLDLEKNWEEYDVWNDEENLKLYKDFIFEVVCNCDKEQADWLHNWIACAVQDPLKEKWHCKTSLYFNSVENSTGKTLLANNIIGMLLSGKMVENCPINVAKMSNKDWTDKFAYGELNNKLVCICNELGYGNNFYELIKDIIDNPTIKIEHKFKDSYKIKNTCRFIFTTNENKIPIKEHDVRLAIFKFNSSWLGTDKMQRLANLFDTRRFNYEFCKLLYNYYKNYEADGNLIKDSYKSKERSDVINENLDEVESIIQDIKDLNIDIYEVFKIIKMGTGSWGNSTESYCLMDYSKEENGFHYVKTGDLLQYLKKNFKIKKSTKAFTQILLNNNIEYIEHRNYKYFKIAEAD